MKKKIVHVIFCVLMIIIVGIASMVAYLSVSEYRPDEEEELEVEGRADDAIKSGESVRIMTWNLGYGALGDNADFFMDGGRMVYTADKERVNTNLSEITKEVDRISPDILLVQEMDISSARTYFINESEYLLENSKSEALAGERAYACNFNVPFVPLPIPPIGKVQAGIEVFSRYDIAQSKRVSLPCPFKWPLRTFNLKRCLEISRMPVEDMDKELVLINLHLEAYDSGEGKIAQIEMLKAILKAEADAGNYVIAGGDFNQVFSNIDTSAYPTLEGKWKAGEIDVSEFEGMNFIADEKTASCRSLDRVLADAKSKDPADFQYYIIDGFVVSSNVEVEDFYVDDLKFVNSDHNPLIMDFKLK